jgi:2-methylcitrate dehydratase
MMKAMGLAATAADGVFATRLAADGFTGPSGTLEWLATGALIADASPVSLAQRTVATVSLELQFADFALAIKYEELPKEVVNSAKRVLLDTLACAFGAVGSDPATIAERTARKTFGEGDAATIVGYPRAATVEGALFVNGVLVRALDLNDTYIGTDPLHPSEVLPTALALCEESGKSGRALIEAIVAGYEASMAARSA